ncbi:putative anaerobic NTP reductase, large subunit [Escherichia phage 107]|uniref:Ribonucleotide reductase of class III (Anaerobic), large subunit n=1 Tax=Yersinia phage fPS-65 TaxID=2052931 RepID=A0A449C4I0_9CAUD|nr:NrdD-like anaerobic ribonucleotide reductase large subunit [Yersinia phage fPS-65]WEW53832.1 putative anaerobic NTP reductase, large subunit [Escherichia phage 107]VEV89273.1 Ribonucleotide reductase of class III (anaerobic), large subunit [Yersinia phage fPS-65]
MTIEKEIEGLIHKTNKDLLNENANKDSRVFPTQRDLMAGIVSKHIAKNMVPSFIMKAHESGIIHFHDIDYSPALPFTNCCLVDLKGMLENGFKLGNAQIETPKSIGVATAIMAQITAQVASHQYGGTTFANVDKVLSPYVKRTYAKHIEDAEKWQIADALNYAQSKTEKDVYDAFQAYEYEVNTLFSSNGQTPFVTITFGTGTDWTERMIQKAILKNRIKGLGRDGITPIFPKLVMFVEEGVNLYKDDPNYDIKQLALECASKRMYPDIISAKNNKAITGSSIPVSPMGCRSFLSAWKDSTGNEILDGRNNLGVVTLNLPRIALDSYIGTQFNEQKFTELFNERMDLCFEALMCRISSLKGVKATVAPILYQEGAFGVRLKPDDDIIELFKNGRSSVSLGYIGIHELNILVGRDIGREILTKMNAHLKQWTERTGFAFSLYSTPAENLCYRFCKLDTEKYGSVKDVTDKGWYTNSFHVSVEENITPFEKISREAPYHFIATGGHISYVELPDMKNNLKGLEAVWDYAAQHLDYFGVNMPVDKCFTCGSTHEMTPTENGFVCSICGETDPKKMNTIRRTCGYLGNPNERGFNLGKNKEIMHRVKHQ